jgi:hypothetical protein
MNQIQIKKSKPLPFINDLVDVLFTKEINNLIDDNCVTVEDKRVFMMFLMTYFYSYLSISVKDQHTKQNLKEFLSNLINNPDKRLKCIELYTTFEKTLFEKNLKLT